MANKKFSEFELKTTTSNVSHIVGYNGAENVRITPANFISGTGGPYLPLAGGIMTGDTKHNDNTKSIWGRTGNDLEIYHDGSNSYIKDVGTGDLRIWADNPNISSLSGNKYFYGNNGSAELYHNGNKKLETTSTGISVTGSVTASNFIVADGSDNYIQFDLNGKNSPFTNQSKSFIFSGQGASGDYLAGTLNFQSRSSAARDINFITGATPEKRLTISGSGKSTFAGDIVIAEATNKGQLFFGSADTNYEIKGGGNFGYLSLNAPILRFDTGGSERMRLDASGNLLIGTSSDLGKVTIQNDTANQYALRILRSTSTNQGLGGFYEGSSNQGELFLLKGDNTISTLINSDGDSYINGGNLGIGTSSPSKKLEVSGAANAIIQSTDTAGAGSFLRMLADVTAENLINWDKDTDLRFATSDSDFANFSEKMRITSAGNLGVGNTNPSQAFVVKDGIVVTGATSEAASTTGDYILAVGKNAGDKSLHTQGDILCDGDIFLGNTAGVGSSKLSVETSAGARGIGFRDSAGIAGTKALILFSTTTEVGSISISTTATSYNTGSDYRLKEDLQDFKGLELVSKIPVYDYKWKADESRSYGVMAHELEEVLPQAVSGEKDAEEMQSVDYSKIVPLLVKSIQELKAEIELLKNK